MPAEQPPEPTCRSGQRSRAESRRLARRRGRQGFAQADVIVEGEFRTQVQTHCCLETHAVVADWRADRLTVYLSTQYAAGVRNELATAFGLPRSRVRVIVEAMGGGFGSKSSAGNYVRAAVALSRMRARRCGWCSTATRSSWTAAIARRRCSAFASARPATGT